MFIDIYLILVYCVGFFTFLYFRFYKMKTGDSLGFFGDFVMAVTVGLLWPFFLIFILWVYFSKKN
jgi:hypothetical protein